MNLRNKTIVLLVPLIIIPILTVGFVSFDKIHKTAKERLTTHVVTLLDQISRHTISSVNTATANLRVLSEQYQLKQYILSEDESLRYDLLLPNLLTLFKTLQETMPNYLEVKYITIDGMEDAYWSSPEIINKTENIASEWYYNELVKMKQNENKSIIIFDENTNNNVILVVRKIAKRNAAVDSYGSKPKLRGYLAILLSLSDLQEEVNKNVIGETGFLSVINSDAKPLLTPQSINDDIARNTSKKFTDAFDVNTTDFFGININEALVFSYWRELIPGVRLVGFLPEKDLINDSYELSKTVLIITVLAMFVVVFMVLASLRYLIMQPLENLNKEVIKIKNGEWDITLDINQNDEIGHLAKSFMDMSFSLKKTHELMHLSHQRLLLHREHSSLAVIEWNTKFECLDWNPAAEKIFGFSKDELMGKHITDKIFSEDAVHIINNVWNELLENNGGTQSVNQNLTKSGKLILCEWHYTPLIDENGNIIGVTSLVDDITDRQKNEERLRQSQKMDAIGQLTGGIAHDFNNMLGVILGFSELLKVNLNDTPNSRSLNKYCDEILNAGERAKKLTSQLLEYSRKAPSSSVEINLEQLLHSMQHMLEKTLTPRIKLIINTEENLWPVLLDRTRTENAIFNICINAMHAMPNGGELKIYTNNLTLTEKEGQLIDTLPGEYIVLSIQDNGMGMSDEIKNKIFDPFFTTKGTDGTGLGMSQVYGFVEQSGGKIQITSELNKGTCIQLYIPRLSELVSESNEKVVDDTSEFPLGNETILVVDDEESLLELTDEILSTFGYTVLRATSAEEALILLRNHHVDLMLSDVIMPGKDGYQLATEAEMLYPKLKIQIASGYSDDRQLNLINETLHEQRLHKPIRSKTLLTIIRKRLDEK